ncbi:membrane protein insertion efficiency factor YidD [Candidatus Parcubacteria bacterium]|nr:MAG: membrane protein insertion efficiency factor YidD [Candidatus Parcubacteria bacterium]
MIEIVVFKVYKFIVGNFLHIMALGGCRHYPTCSEYSLLAVKKYGYTRGLILSLKRLLSCNPFSKGGVSLP